MNTERLALMRKVSDAKQAPTGPHWDTIRKCWVGGPLPGSQVPTLTRFGKPLQGTPLLGQTWNTHNGGQMVISALGCFDTFEATDQHGQKHLYRRGRISLDSPPKFEHPLDLVSQA